MVWHCTVLYSSLQDKAYNALEIRAFKKKEGTTRYISFKLRSSLYVAILDMNATHENGDGTTRSYAQVIISGLIPVRLRN